MKQREYICIRYLISWFYKCQECFTKENTSSGICGLAPRASHRQEQIKRRAYGGEEYVPLFCLLLDCVCTYAHTKSRAVFATGHACGGHNRRLYNACTQSTISVLRARIRANQCISRVKRMLLWNPMKTTYRLCFQVLEEIQHVKVIFLL